MQATNGKKLKPIILEPRWMLTRWSKSPRILCTRWYSALIGFSPGILFFPFHQKPKFTFIYSDLVWFVVSSISRTSLLGWILWDINKVIIVICQFGAENRSHLPTVFRATLVPVALRLRHESGQICPHCCWQLEVALSWRRRRRTHVESRAWSQSCQIFGPGIDDILFTFALLPI